MSDKEMVLEVVERLPKTVSLDEIREELELIAAVQEGIAQADEGKLTPHSEVKKLLARWTSK